MHGTAAVSSPTQSGRTARKISWGVQGWATSSSLDISCKLAAGLACSTGLLNPSSASSWCSKGWGAMCKGAGCDVLSLGCAVKARQPRVTIIQRSRRSRRSIVNILDVVRTIKAQLQTDVSVFYLDGKPWYLRLPPPLPSPSPGGCEPLIPSHSVEIWGALIQVLWWCVWMAWCFIRVFATGRLALQASLTAAPDVPWMR